MGSVLALSRRSFGNVNFSISSFCRYAMAVPLVLALLSCRSAGTERFNAQILELQKRAAAVQDFFRSIDQSLDLVIAAARSPGAGSSALSSDYVWKKNVLSDYNHRRSSNIHYVSGARRLSADTARFINRSEGLEGVWSSTKKKFSNRIASQYIYHPAMNLLRVFPWIDTQEMFGETVDFEVFSFYLDAVAPENSDHRMVCSELGSDYAGYGLVTACSKAFLDGDGAPVIVGVDVVVRNLDALLSSGVAGGSSLPLILVDPTGAVALATKSAQRLIGTASNMTATANAAFNVCVRDCLSRRGSCRSSGCRFKKDGMDSTMYSESILSPGWSLLLISP